MTVAINSLNVEAVMEDVEGNHLCVLKPLLMEAVE